MSDGERLRVSSADRRVELLDLATEIIAANGLEGLTMDALSAAAGIGKPVVYRVFSNREAVMIGMLHRHALSLSTAVDNAIATCNGELECMLRESARVYFRSSPRISGPMRLVLNGIGASGELATARRKVWDLAARRWSLRLVGFGVPKRDAMALSKFLLAGLARFSDEVANRQMTKAEAERLYVSIAVSAIRTLKA
jgi:AcrR family transcriptional regulator